MLMQLWAIERVCDQKLLPLRADRAHSYADFDDKGAPRLFLTRQAALCAMTSWKKGRWQTTVSWESEDPFGVGYYVKGRPHPIAGTQRLTEVRVVPVVVMKVIEGVTI